MRAFSKLSPFSFFLMLSFFYAFAASAAVQPHGGMMRYPDVSSSHIVFVYADDIWLVPRSGGVASPLASPPGGEAFPRFSYRIQREL
jgi:tricorn protease